MVVLVPGRAARAMQEGQVGQDLRRRDRHHHQRGAAPRRWIASEYGGPGNVGTLRQAAEALDEPERRAAALG